MNTQNRVRILAVAAVLVLMIGGAGSYYTIRQINGLRELQFATQETLGTAYKLLVDTSSISTTTGVLHQRVEQWRTTIDATDEGIQFVTNHRALDFLDVGDDVESVRFGWRSAQDIFRQADDQIETILTEGVLGIEVPIGLDHITGYLESLSAGQQASTDLEGSIGLITSLSEGDYSEETYQEAVRFVRTLQLLMNTGSANLNFFVTANLQGLADSVAVEAAEVVRNATIITAIVVSFLVLAAMTALLTGTHFLETANRTLEERVRERTSSIQSLLDVSQQGFLSFGRDFLVRPEYSRECDVIFGKPILGEHVGELLYGTGRERDEFVDAMNLVFSEQSIPEVVFDLLESEIRVGNKIVEVDFRKIDGDRIMCSLVDATEERKLRAKVDAENELRAMLLTVVLNHRDFAALIQEADTVFEILGRYLAGTEDIGTEETLHEVHTFKANAAFLKLERTARRAHELEEAITDAAFFADGATVAGGVEALREAYRMDLSVVEEHLGSGWVTREASIVVSREELEILERELLDTPNMDPDALKRLRMLRMVPLRTLESRFIEMTTSLAESRGKRVASPVFEGGDILVDAGISEILSSTITHLVRNMIDHGIERPQERETMGKPPEGRVRCVAEQQPNTVVITIEDDGRGIDLEAIRVRAIERKLIDPEGEVSREEVARLIFRDGFSTAPVVSATSGRGIGLPAVRRAIGEIGGKLTMSTSPGKGTRFVIVLPTERAERMAV